MNNTKEYQSDYDNMKMYLHIHIKNQICFLFFLISTITFFVRNILRQTERRGEREREQDRENERERERTPQQRKQKSVTSHLPLATPPHPHPPLSNKQYREKHRHIIFHSLFRISIHILMQMRVCLSCEHVNSGSVR